MVERWEGVNVGRRRELKEREKGIKRGIRGGRREE